MARLLSFSEGVRASAQLLLDFVQDGALGRGDLRAESKKAAGCFGDAARQADHAIVHGAALGLAECSPDGPRIALPGREEARLRGFLEPFVQDLMGDAS